MCEAVGLPQNEPIGSGMEAEVEREGREEEEANILPNVFAGLLIEASKRKVENTPEAVIAHSNIGIDVSFIFK